MTEISNNPQVEKYVNTEAITASPVFNLFKNLRSFNSKQIGFDELERLVKYDANVEDKSSAYLSMLKPSAKKRPTIR